jgi:hypothetical protein
LAIGAMTAHAIKAPTASQRAAGRRCAASARITSATRLSCAVREAKSQSNTSPVASWSANTSLPNRHPLDARSQPSANEATISPANVLMCWKLNGSITRCRSASRRRPSKPHQDLDRVDDRQRDAEAEQDVLDVLAGAEELGRARERRERRELDPVAERQVLVGRQSVPKSAQATKSSRHEGGLAAVQRAARAPRGA